MDEVVLLCVIMVVGPFFFFIVMVCSLKAFAYLNIDLFKPDTEAEGSSRPRPSRFDGEVIDDAVLNEQYPFRDRWTTGLQIAANLPINIAMTEIPLSSSVHNRTSQISSQVPHSQTSYPRPQVRQSSEPCTANIPISNPETSIPMYHGVTSEDMSSEPPPPDYNQAGLLLKVQAEQHEIPPPSYNDCLQMKMQKICFPKI